MADLVLDKDVLVLICSIASKRIELARATFLKTCENTCRVNIRSVDCLNDLRGLEREQRDIVLYIHDTFESEKDPQSAALDALKDEQDAMKLATMKFTLCLVFPEKNVTISLRQ